MDSNLKVEGLHVRYGPVLAVRDLSFAVRPGEILAVAGANGAGKSSTVMSIVGGTEGAVTTGSIRFGDVELVGMPAERISALGIACVPEGRRVFTALSVFENLVLGSNLRRRTESFSGVLAEVFHAFPALEQYRRKPAGLLSGGQLQQLAIGRAMMRRPNLMVVDEPSIGLAPNLVTEILGQIARFRDGGMSVILVEQNAERARAIADEWMVLQKGSLTASSWRTTNTGS